MSTLPDRPASPYPGETTGQLSPECPQAYLRALSAGLAAKVTELEQAEHALRKSEARFRSLAESAPVGIFSLDSAGHLGYANQRLGEICGLDDGLRDGLPWASVLHPDDRDRALIDQRAAMMARQPYQHRVRLIRPSGEVRWVDILAGPATDIETGHNYVGTVVDVTEAVAAQAERDELQARLQVSGRLESVSQLAGGVAHDFNNLLAVILNYTQFVSDALDQWPGTGEDPQLVQMGQDLAAIGEAGRRAAELTHQLLAIGRREVIHAETFDLNELVAETGISLGRTIGEHARFELVLADGMLPVTADRCCLDQVLVNLVVNARDAMGTGGSVQLATDQVDLDMLAGAGQLACPAGRYARITVTDDGAGMPAEVAARAFEPFFTTKPRGNGTGLGLATVHGVVRQLGGDVTIDSEPGRGTSVRVYLPVSQGAAQTGHDPEGEPALAGHGETILVVEDDSQVRAVSTRILAGHGYRPLAVGDGPAALALLADSTVPVDLLLTDVVMPEMSGPHLAEHASVLRPALRVVFMSGYAFGAFGPEKEEKGPVILLHKPFTPADLLAHVAQALAGPEPTAAS